jgi:hypothetical protein
VHELRKLAWTVLLAACSQPTMARTPDASASGGGGGGGGTDASPGGGSGGSADSSPLVFAIVGDTRPPIPEDTLNYPTAIITTIFQDIAAETPTPSFVIGTGDYMFSIGLEAQNMANTYMTARAAFPGAFYPVMGNHECDSFTDGNCAGSPTTNMTVFLTTMLGPIQQTLPYYSQMVSAPDNSWTAKFVYTACNAWDATQANWLQTALAPTTTYTFVIRHEGVADMSGTPCADSQTIIDANPLTLLIVGHTHEYAHDGSDKEIINGIGGAPLSSGTNYGYSLVSRNSDDTLTVTTKDYMSHDVIDTFSIDASGSGV